MKRRDVLISDEHDKWIRKKFINLSKLIRALLDKEMKKRIR